ncbi:SPW repeat protein [Nocardia miyunensis]|uniref:SPW repeat protein n=1 Tax=Nocardia miyunensis TaxID=282684 RepID=UPI000830C239|nr:SPW repeat protein [Nocardia miyunensis]
MATESMSRHPDIVELRAKYEKYELAAMEPAAQAVTGLLFLTGLYIAISGWVVGFHGYQSLTANNLIVGIALAVLALGFASMYGRIHGIGWVAPAIGVWMIITPWVVRGDVAHPATIWSNVVAGAVTLLLGLSSMALVMRRSR